MKNLEKGSYLNFEQKKAFTEAGSGLGTGRGSNCVDDYE